MDPSQNNDQSPQNTPQPGVSENPAYPWTVKQKPNQNPPQPIPQPPPPQQNYPPPIPIQPTTVINTGSTSQPSPPPPPPVAEEPAVTITQVEPKKFPVLLVTSLVLLTISGFSGSYIYFRVLGQSRQKQMLLPKITPPVTEAPFNQVASGSANTNPFDSGTYENPFSNETSYQNPFGEEENVSTDAAYQNPFNNLE